MLPSTTFPAIAHVWPLRRRAAVPPAAPAMAAPAVAVAAGEAGAADAAVAPNDRVGLGWRPELAAGIFEAFDRIDVLEVVADNYFEATRTQRQGLRLMAQHVALHVHSIDLGLAGSQEVGTARLARLARLVGETRAGRLVRPSCLRARRRDRDRPPGGAAAHRGLGDEYRAQPGQGRAGRRLHAGDGEHHDLDRPAGQHVERAGMDFPDHHGERLRPAARRANLHANAANFGFDPLGSSTTSRSPASARCISRAAAGSRRPAASNICSTITCMR